MRSILRVVTPLWLCLAAAVSTVSASDGQKANENLIITTGAEFKNELALHQTEDGGHTLRLHIGQEGALLIGPTWLRTTPSLLAPGTIDQSGKDHILIVDISGQDNQPAVRQSGARNAASIVSVGRANMVSISQAGRGNNAAVTQAGLRNSVAILQR